MESQLLMSAVVQVRSGQGAFIEGRALLDTCATHNFITEKFVKRLKLAFRVDESPICGFGESRSHALGSIEVTLRSRLNEFERELNCLVVPRIADSIPNEQFPREQIDIPKRVRLADPRFHVPRPVDIIIGSGPSLACLSIGQVNLTRENCEMYLQKTQLGWVIVGGIRSREGTVATCNLVELNHQLCKFWELEECNEGIGQSSEDIACEAHYLQNTRRDPNGRYIVRLPFRRLEVELGDSRSRALRQFHSLLKKFERDPPLKVEYSKVMQEYLDLGHMSLIDQEMPGEYYLPHHAVIKPSSTTTKTRVVFNASAKTDLGRSLNDELMVGPTIQSKLFAHLLKFRTFIFVLTADIEKMYRQIVMDPRDRKFQRILWLHQEKIHTFELNTVTFGVASAPFLAIRTLHKLADDEERDFPKASRTLKRDLYVDDLLSGANSLDEVLEIRDELIKLLKRGGFSIRKWASNHAHVLDNLEERAFDNDHVVEGNPIVKTLGISWNSRLDQFTYSVKPIALPVRITKRNILSEIARIFDPLGLLGPVVLAAKLIMQECWKAKIGWDESVTLELHTRWASFASELKEIDKLSVPRLLILPHPHKIELHGFCDASKVGYGACLYVRSISQTGHILVRLACAKSRVAPVKQTTIPRLELCGALTLVRLFHESKKSFTFHIDKVVFWSDSEIVLQWLKKTPQSLKVFEGNRVAEIQGLSGEAEWRHIAGKDNPADVLSRGQSPASFVRNISWFSGLSWLYQEEREWPQTRKSTIEPIPGMREPTCLVAVAERAPFYRRFSSYYKLVNVTAYMLRWRYRSDRGVSNLGVHERSRAEWRLLLLIQREQFAKDLKSLSKDIQPRGSKLAALNPFVDPEGLLRVGGRLRNAHISYAQKFPILLPSFHHVTDLIIRELHLTSLHGGVQSTLYNIRQRFWLLDGRNQVRKIVRRCVTCIRHRPVMLQGKMSDLPRTRVEQAAVFERVGIDYCGPFDIKEKKFRNRVILKAYCCVFICMATKAVHLEIVSDQTTEAFVAALRRFIGRRGVPSHIYSDNGSNFIGANNQLQAIYSLIDSKPFHEAIIDFSTHKNIIWHFNPPLSPHFGGIWEAAVKSFKHHLKRVVGGQLLTFERLTTLAVEIESILNSRPIGTMSADPNDPAALTPAHFLIGRPLTMLPDHDLTSISDNRLPDWRFIVKARQDFWKRWHIEYLNEMQKRQKWLESKGEIKPGSIVIVVDKRQPCHQWPLGVIVEVFPGSDGVVRVASVKIKDTVFKRNITTLCPLPIVN